MACPNDWYSLARVVLSGGDYVLWKTDFVKNCIDIELHNKESKTSQTLTKEKLLGRNPYDTNEAQAHFPPGLLPQI